jgi:hypothetical protein
MISFYLMIVSRRNSYLRHFSYLNDYGGSMCVVLPWPAGSTVLVTMWECSSGSHSAFSFSVILYPHKYHGTLYPRDWLHCNTSIFIYNTFSWDRDSNRSTSPSAKGPISDTTFWKRLIVSYKNRPRVDGWEGSRLSLKDSFLSTFFSLIDWLIDLIDWLNVFTAGTYFLKW